MDVFRGFFADLSMFSEILVKLIGNLQLWFVRLFGTTRKQPLLIIFFCVSPFSIPLILPLPSMNFIYPCKGDTMSNSVFLFSENMSNVYETFGEEETIVLTDLLRDYLGK